MPRTDDKKKSRQGRDRDDDMRETALGPGPSPQGRAPAKSSGSAAMEAEKAAKTRLGPDFLGSTANNPRLIVVLEGAFLETAKVRDKYVLLNGDKHHAIMERSGRSSFNARPNIVHSTLLQLLSSPLNCAGLLQVYIHTAKGVLIRVHPSIRLPPDFDRFCGLMVQLLEQRKIRASDGGIKLMEIIKNPLTLHLPPGIPKFLLTRNATRHIRMNELAKELVAKYAPIETGRDGESKVTGTPILFVIGAVAHGSVTPDYVEEAVCISNAGMLASTVAARLTGAFEEAWNIF